MKHSRLLYPLALALLLLTSSCNRSSGQMWEDTKTAGRYMGRGIRSLVGKGNDSRQIQSADEFIGPSSKDYIALRDEDRAQQYSLEEVAPQSYVTPGEPGSGLPGIDGFYEPRTTEQAAIFQNIHFDTNDHIVRGDDNRTILQNIADYLKSHPKTYIFIEGHCDQRGPAAYNLALGARRANTVRTALIQMDVDLDHIFTISYGKERLLIQDNSPESLALNRRAQFKLYTK